MARESSWRQALPGHYVGPWRLQERGNPSALPSLVAEGLLSFQQSKRRNTRTRNFTHLHSCKQQKGQ